MNEITNEEIKMQIAKLKGLSEKLNNSRKQLYESLEGLGKELKVNRHLVRQNEVVEYCKEKHLNLVKIFVFFAGSDGRESLLICSDSINSHKVIVEIFMNQGPDTYHVDPDSVGVIIDGKIVWGRSEYDLVDSEKFGPRIEEAFNN